MNATREWWTDFFHGTWGEWQALGHPAEQTRAEADFLMASLGIEAGDSVLDLACGTGRHSVELATRGVDVVGVDFNASALAIAEQSAKERSVSPTFLHRDMRDLVWEEQFDAAFNYFSSFGYFEDDTENLRAAEGVVRALRPDGRFLIETHVMESVFPDFRSHLWNRWDETSRLDHVLQDTRWDAERGRVDTDWTFVRGGDVTTAHSSMRLYTYRELSELLREAGFKHCRGLESLTGEPFTVGSRRLSLVAMK